MDVFGWMYFGRGLLDASNEAADAKQTAGRARARADDLEKRMDRLTMVCEALWTLLRDKLGVSDLELVDRVNAVDMADGQLDGKVRKTPVSCPKCKRTIAPRFGRCVYCGQGVVHDPFA